MKHFLYRYDHFVAVIVGLGIILPVFFQIEGGIFRDTGMIFDSRGLINRLPIPISVMACLIGLLLIGRYNNAIPAFIIFFSSFLLLFVSFLIMGNGRELLIQTKFIKMSQFTLPMTALILGQIYVFIDDRLLVLSKSFFVVLFFMTLMQMYCSWQQGNTMLIPYLFLPHLPLFSIYQHLQYVPAVFASAFLIVLFVLGSDNVLRKWILIFMPIMVLYLLVSTTLTGMFLLTLGGFAYMLLYVNIKKRTIIKLAGVAFLIILLAFGYLYHYRGQNMLEGKFSVVGTNEVNGIEIAGIKNRLSYWEFYGGEITKDAKTFFFGHALPMDRTKHTSAHNYYLDLIYNFGLLSLMPMLVLIGATLRGIYRKRKDIVASPELMGVTIVVLYLLFVENMLKVGMRQPYPGIFTFFLWGILMSKLSVFSLREPDLNETAPASS